MKNATSTESTKDAVLYVYPKAVEWWNCMEFDWLIWDQRTDIPTAKIIGCGLTKDEAWADAFNRLTSEQQDSAYEAWRSEQGGLGITTTGLDV